MLTGQRRPLVRVGRQAIVDRSQRLFGYELLFRAGEGDTAGLTTVADHDAATSQVITAVLGDFGDRTLASGARFFVNLTRAFVTGELPLAAGLEHLVLEVTEDIATDAAVLDGVRALRERGFAVAVDDYEGEEHRHPTLPLAQFVKLVLDPDRPDRFEHLAALVDDVRARAPQALVVVERVETREDFEAARALGVDLFQGYWVQRPVVISSPSVEASRVLALRLLVALGDPETPLAVLERLVLSDAALSFRVLRLAGSSAVAVREPVSSVRQAVVLVGRRLLASWAALAVIGRASSDGSAHAALTLVLARAGACARLVPGGAQEAFITGLLSGAAEALDTPLGDLLASVPVPAGLEAALRRHEGPAGRALAAVLAVEGSPAAPSGAVVPEGVERAYAAALGEAATLASGLADPSADPV